MKETVFLGDILHQHLSWKPQILSVSRKISKPIGVIYKSRFCLPKTSLCSFCYSLVYPYLIYCVSVWGSAYQSNLSRIIILQKRIIRIKSKVFFDSHTGVLFKQQEILKFSDIYLYQICKFMKSIFLKEVLLPNYFRDMFTLARQIHSHNTRNSSVFYIPHCRTNFRKFSIRFQGPKFFNSLSREIQNGESISLFGKRLKRSFFSQSNILFAKPHTFSFLFFSFFSSFLCSFLFFSLLLKLNPNFHSVPLTCMVYPIVQDAYSVY